MCVRDVADGMTGLLLRGPAVPVHGIHALISQIAREVLNDATHRSTSTRPDYSP